MKLGLSSCCPSSVSPPHIPCAVPIPGLCRPILHHPMHKKDRDGLTCWTALTLCTLLQPLQRHTVRGPAPVLAAASLLHHWDGCRVPMQNHSHAPAAKGSQSNLLWQSVFYLHAGSMAAFMHFLLHFKYHFRKHWCQHHQTEKEDGFTSCIWSSGSDFRFL